MYLPLSQTYSHYAKGAGEPPNQLEKNLLTPSAEGEPPNPDLDLYLMSRFVRFDLPRDLLDRLLRDLLPRDLLDRLPRD